MASPTQPDARELDPLLFVWGWQLALEELEEHADARSPGAPASRRPMDRRSSPAGTTTGWPPSGFGDGDAP